MSDCTLCYQQPADPNRADGLCVDCGQWEDYWRALTPEEKAQEQRMMIEYVCDPENR